MKNLDWNDLKAFIHVARSGGLSAAAIELRSSPATIGRKMLSLEQALARRLFIRRQTGYELTEDGRALLAKAQAMEASARPIEDWLSADMRRPVVRISAGTWIANLLSANFSRLWTPDDPFHIGFKTAEARLDIAHREVEIGVRNRPAEGMNLASRPAGEVAYAPFRARNQPVQGAENWVAIAPDDAATPSARWTNAQPNLTIAAWANTPRTLYDLISAGVGTGVLPCFAGDRDPLLERAGEPIAELHHRQWIVMHDDDRHRPEVRKVIERMAALIAAHAPLFAGERPLGGD
ncbi:LysR family transcriptional regulator [Mesorhizobium sp. CGMCC 1.15528]|uniref:LysR family transcriptional regulator n=1 Tax=Mesorhizobium zhangyense TaxID=1776730 RepID=A0A7C9R5U0_9HYPH|nr:LysR family transcriptional regulator [Mesorhizobium zhangyense]NGN40338.1 LysR family transcriptional regulator [Mesorhizobium zhangyense]